MAKKYQIPFDKTTGDMLDYVGYYEDHIEWRDSCTFDAKMTFVQTEKGRSSFRFILQDENCNYWSLMYNSVEEYVRHAKNGVVDGKWETVKRGSNYGIIFVVPDEK